LSQVRNRGTQPLYDSNPESISYDASKQIGDSIRKVLLLSGASLIGASNSFAATSVEDDALKLFDKMDDPSIAKNKIKSASDFVNEIQSTRPLNSDELEISFNEESLGLTIEETIYSGFPVVVVKDIKNPYLLSTYPNLRKGAILTKIDNTTVDGLPMKLIATTIKGAQRPFVIRFRDPSRYLELLDSTMGLPRRVITSSYLPANARDAGAAEQIITVERLDMPPPEERTRASVYLDVMEIQYVAQVAGREDIVDSSRERAPPGTSGGSIYYVLGQQNGPPGKFPQGWDITLRGMVRGEKRRVTLPYTLAYGRKGVKDRNIPPFATMIYTVKCMSIT
jgi:hypothetical protein